MHSLLSAAKVDVISGGSTASAGTVIKSDVLDMTGYEGVTFLGTLGTTHADNGLEAQFSTDSSTSNMEDMLNSFVAATSTSLSLDIGRPKRRYVRARYARAGSNSKAGPITAIRYGAHTQPVTNATSTHASRFLASPSSGQSTSS